MRFVLFTAANLRSSLYSRAGYARFLSIVRVFLRTLLHLCYLYFAFHSLSCARFCFSSLLGFAFCTLTRTQIAKKQHFWPRTDTLISQGFQSKKNKNRSNFPLFRGNLPKNLANSNKSHIFALTSLDFLQNQNEL